MSAWLCCCCALCCCACGAPVHAIIRYVLPVLDGKGGPLFLTHIRTYTHTLCHGGSWGQTGGSTAGKCTKGSSSSTVVTNRALQYTGKLALTHPSSLTLTPNRAPAGARPTFSRSVSVTIKSLVSWQDCRATCTASSWTLTFKGRREGGRAGGRVLVCCWQAVHCCCTGTVAL